MASEHGNSASRALGLPYFGVAAILFVFWTAMTVAVVVTFALSNRPGEDDNVAAAAPADTPVASPTTRPTATPRGDGRPAAVPQSARIVTATVDFGSVGAADAASHVFFNWRCSGNVFAIATSRETIYAELPCGEYWLSDDQSRPFLGKAVRVQLTATRFRVEATGAGVIGLPATRVWIETR